MLAGIKVYSHLHKSSCFFIPTFTKSENFVFMILFHDDCLAICTSCYKYFS